MSHVESMHRKAARKVSSVVGNYITWNSYISLSENHVSTTRMQDYKRMRAAQETVDRLGNDQIVRLTGLRAEL